MISAGRGATAIDQDAALDWMGGAPLRLDERAGQDANATITTLRGVLQGSPTQETWDAIVATLSRCERAHVRAAVDYAEATVGRWEVDPDALSKTKVLAGVHRLGLMRDGAQRNTWGELRVAPIGWVERARTMPTPELRLARAMSWGRTGRTQRFDADMLGGEDVAHIEQLMFGSHAGPELSATLKHLPSASFTSRLHALGAAGFTRGHVRLLNRVGSQLELKHIKLDQTAYDPYPFPEPGQREGFRALLSAHATRRVTEISLCGCSREPLAMIQLVPDALPSLSTLNLGYHDPHDCSSMRQLVYDLGNMIDIVPECETVRLQFTWRIAHLHELAYLLLHALPSTRRLDLGRVVFDTPSEVAAARRVLLDHLPGSPLTQSVEEVRLGRWYDERLANELDARGVRVVDAE